jgi:predicted house-cleaning noncanonical NTP pyrophosphatase (MazG superfamily)
MVFYHKLIRDQIPEVINKKGKECEIRTLNQEEYMFYLNKKLQEELDEYNQSGDLTELVDLTEVIYAIVCLKGLTLEEFEMLRLEKRETRGGFEKKLLLVSVTE